MDSDKFIDFNHIYYIIADKLFKEKFVESKDPFNFQSTFEQIDFKFLENDTSFFFLENSVPPLHKQVRYFLKQQGFIEDNIHNYLDTKMSDKGIVTIGKGGIEKYKSYRERQEQLQLEIQQTTIDTNKSVMISNRTQRITSYISESVSILALVIAGVVAYITYTSHTDSQDLLEMEKKSLDLQLKNFPSKKNQIEDTIFLKNKDSVYRKYKSTQLRIYNPCRHKYPVMANVF